MPVSQITDLMPPIICDAPQAWQRRTHPARRRRTALCTTGTAALKHLGYAVDAHTRPTEALAAVRARPTAYDAAIIDLAMPELSGLELAERIHQVAPALPIILTSGNPGDLTFESPQQHGVQQLLTKPATLTELADATHLALHPGFTDPRD